MDCVAYSGGHTVKYSPTEGFGGETLMNYVASSGGPQG